MRILLVVIVIAVIWPFVAVAISIVVGKIIKDGRESYVAMLRAVKKKEDRRMKVDLIVGARPNYVKAAALLPALRHEGLRVRLVDTRQHVDDLMSGAMRRDLGLPDPEVSLVGPSASTLARVFEAYSTLLADAADVPDRVIVVGDVDSSLACALAARKHGIPIDHVEAGLRCDLFDMSEEINRRLIDQIADQLFVTEPSGMENLKNEGVRGSVYFAGNVMIDTLTRELVRAKKGNSRRYEYALITLHRAEIHRYVDELREAILAVAASIPVVIPAHPSANSLYLGLSLRSSNVHVCGPMRYHNFIKTMEASQFVITDSGGVQDEAAWLGLPCFTLRPATERPITLRYNNHIVWPPSRLDAAVRSVVPGRRMRNPPELWDGHAAPRVAAQIAARERG